MLNNRLITAMYCIAKVRIFFFFLNPNHSYLLRSERDGDSSIDSESDISDLESDVSKLSKSVQSDTTPKVVYSCWQFTNKRSSRSISVTARLRRIDSKVRGSVRARLLSLNRTLAKKFVAGYPQVRVLTPFLIRTPSETVNRAMASIEGVWR